MTSRDPRLGPPPPPPAPHQVTDGPAAEFPETTEARLRFFGRRKLKKLLADHPWVEYPGEISSTPAVNGAGPLNVSLTTAEGVTWVYNTNPAERHSLFGRQAVWCAGTPGESWLAVSLTEGRTVSLAEKWLVQPDRSDQG
ncbi:MAG: hypothetical protein ACRDPH_11585 [Marmoricola sp.]